MVLCRDERLNIHSGFCFFYPAVFFYCLLSLQKSYSQDLLDVSIASIAIFSACRSESLLMSGAYDEMDCQLFYSLEPDCADLGNNNELRLVEVPVITNRIESVQAEFNSSWPFGGFDGIGHDFDIHMTKSQIIPEEIFFEVTSGSSTLHYIGGVGLALFEVFDLSFVSPGRTDGAQWVDSVRSNEAFHQQVLHDFSEKKLMLGETEFISGFSDSAAVSGLSNNAIAQPWGETVLGVLTFRGSPSRTWHGEGPVPREPEVLWRFPDQPMCSMSSVAGFSKEWCGMGWTGQPAVFEMEEQLWIVFGGYDGAVHFVDGETGARLLPDFQTNDIIKGSVTIDPDGYPLVYVGSRDNKLRVLAIDGDEPEEIWSLNYDIVFPIKWNNDWDSSPLIMDDYLFAGGETGRFYIVRLNRSDGIDGRVSVDPELIWSAASWDDELITAIGDNNVSIENSPVILGDILYFANSGGLVQGWDIGGLDEDIMPAQVFRFWVGDDVDASLVADDEGMLYVGVEYERGTERSHELGQIIKLDPTSAEDPLVWAVEDRPFIGSGVWATPAIHNDLLIVPTAEGKVLGIDRSSGEVEWTMYRPGPIWSSPTIVDDVLVIGDCSGRVVGFELDDAPIAPSLLWDVDIGGCVESSAVIWHGTVYMGSRDGYLYALRDAEVDGYVIEEFMTF